jgi:TolB protein
MDSYLFAESSPVWFGQIGSTDPTAERQSAVKLLEALDLAEENMKKGYGNAPIPRLLSHFAKARTRLEQLTD